jgi:CBS domain-containing protein
MQLREIMTPGVVTADSDTNVLVIAQLMRDHRVGSVVICDPQGGPTAMVTDRDLTVRVLADQRPDAEPVRYHASRPLVTGDPEMDLEEAAVLMVLDDIAVRTGNLEVAQRMTQEVIEGALPEFFFHERG